MTPEQNHRFNFQKWKYFSGSGTCAEHGDVIGFGIGLAVPEIHTRMYVGEQRHGSPRGAATQLGQVCSDSSHFHCGLHSGMWTAFTPKSYSLKFAGKWRNAVRKWTIWPASCKHFLPCSSSIGELKQEVEGGGAVGLLLLCWCLLEFAYIVHYRHLLDWGDLPGIKY